jgi:hypothetical protein
MESWASVLTVILDIARMAGAAVILGIARTAGTAVILDIARAAGTAFRYRTGNGPTLSPRNFFGIHLC